jgi:hypothetical protein
VQQFIDWVSAYDVDTKEYVSIDITGFDGSQRGASLALEELYLQFFNVPEDLVKFYLEDKLDAKTRTFHLGLMRLSGELFTWLFNTVFQVARTVTKYQIPYGEPMAGSGDDIELFKVYPEQTNWTAKWQYVDVCEEKRIVGSRGDFCSWILKGGYAVRNPQLLYMRLRAAVSRGKIHDVIDGYFLDFMSLFSKADVLYQILGPNELDYVNALSNFFHNVRKETGVHKRLNFNVEISTAADNELEKASFLMSTYEKLGDQVYSVVDAVKEPIISAYTAPGAITYSDFE